MPTLDHPEVIPTGHGNVAGRYLVIEPDRSEQVLLRVFFRRCNIRDDQLVFVSSVEKVPVDRYRLVLCDLNRDGSEDLAMLCQLRRMMPDCPVVVISGQKNFKSGVEAVRLGAQDYLVKGSFNDHQFRKTIRFAVERHFMQKEMQLSREQYVELFDTNPQPSVVYELDTLRLVKVNRRFCELYGYSREEALKLTARDVRVPAEHGRLPDDLGKLKSFGLLEISSIQHRKSNGEIMTVDVSSRCLRHADSDLVIATMNDVSEKVSYEHNLLLSNERFEHAARATRDVIYDWDLQTNDMFWGDSLHSQFGYEPGAVKFNIQKWTACVHPEDREDFVEHFDLLISGGELQTTWEREYRMCRADGSYAFVTDRALIIRSENGMGLRIIGAIEDISHRKEAELQLEEAFNELQRYNARYADLFTEAPAFICYLKGPSHEFQLANPEYIRLIGGREVIGKTVRDALPEIAEQGFVDRLDDVYRTGQSMSGREAPVFFVEKSGTGKRRAYINYLYSPSRDSAGNVEGIYVFGVDVTDLVRSRKRIEQASEERKALINSTDDLIWSVSRDGILVTANEPFLKRIRELSGRNIQEGDSLHLSELDGTIIRRWKSHYERAFAGERFTIHEKMEGGNRHTNFTFNPILNDEGKVTGVACYARDVTERTNHLKAIQEQNRQLKEIAWLQSHVIRAPLARMMGLCHLIKEGEEADCSREDVIQHLMESAVELDSVITEISHKTESI